METPTPLTVSARMQVLTMRQTQSGQENEEDLVASLRNRLMSSRSKLNAWVEEQKAVCDTLTNRYRDDKNTFQDQIHTKSQSLLAFKLERGLNLSDKGDESNHSNSDQQQQQQQQEEAMKESIQRLKEKVNAQMIALEDLKEQKVAKEASTGTTKPLDDSGDPIKERHDELLSIVKGYHDITGLSFEKAENERLRFSFSGLDKNDRSRQFSFLLSTSPEDMYLVEECEPPIPDDQLTHLVKTLNENEDMLNFFQEIRSTWSALVA